MDEAGRRGCRRRFSYDSPACCVPWNIVEASGSDGNGGVRAFDKDLGPAGFGPCFKDPGRCAAKARVSSSSSKGAGFAIFGLGRAGLHWSAHEIRGHSYPHRCISHRKARC